MAEKKVNSRTTWLYTHFFHFFDIPNYIPYKLKKKLFKHWNNYFNSRDALAEKIITKDEASENLNADVLINYMVKMRKEISDTADVFYDINNRKSNDYSNLVTAENNFASMINDIISWQNSHNWKME